jgi:hypothetical protein
MADLMPGFGSALDDEERWDLIDFVRANADAARLGSSGAGTGETFAAPDFSAECPDGSTVSIKQLRGRIIHVVFAGARSEGRLRSLTGLNLGSDVTNIVVWIDASIARPVAMCAVVDPAVSETFAVYRDSDAGQLEGTEFLVGPAGELRSMWYPGLGQDWSVPDVLRREIEEVRGAPASRPSSHGDHKH